MLPTEVKALGKRVLGAATFTNATLVIVAPSAKANNAEDDAQAVQPAASGEVFAFGKNFKG